MRIYHMAALAAATLALGASAKLDPARYYKIYNDTTVPAECSWATMTVSAGCSTTSGFGRISPYGVTRIEGDHIVLRCPGNDPQLNVWDDYDGAIRARVGWSCPAAPPGVRPEQVMRVTQVVSVTGTLSSCGVRDSTLSARTKCSYTGLTGLNITTGGRRGGRG